MPVPSLFDLTLPMLEFLSDGQIHTFPEATDYLAKRFDLTESEKHERVPSGVQTRLQNRVGWARTELKSAGLLEYITRGSWRITDRGRQVLSDKPGRIDRSFLNQYEEYRKFTGGQTSTTAIVDAIGDTSLRESENTPEEDLRTAYETIRGSLADEILDVVKNCSPSFFENLVVDLLLRMGYGGSRIEAGRAIGRSGDEGIDGVINEDRLGLDVIYIQAKRWENTVGRPEIQKFAGALQGQKASKGVFITTSDFSSDAQRFAESVGTKIVLIPGTQLAELMIDYCVGVTTEATYELKRIDSAYFEGG